MFYSFSPLPIDWSLGDCVWDAFRTPHVGEMPACLLSLHSALPVHLHPLFHHLRPRASIRVLGQRSMMGRMMTNHVHLSFHHLYPGLGHATLGHETGRELETRFQDLQLYSSESPTAPASHPSSVHHGWMQRLQPFKVYPEGITMASFPPLAIILKKKNTQIWVCQYTVRVTLPGEPVQGLLT